MQQTFAFVIRSLKSSMTRGGNERQAAKKIPPRFLVSLETIRCTGLSSVTTSAVAGLPSWCVPKACQQIISATYPKEIAWRQEISVNQLQHHFITCSHNRRRMAKKSWAPVFLFPFPPLRVAPDHVAKNSFKNNKKGHGRLATTRPGLGGGGHAKLSESEDVALRLERAGGKKGLAEAIDARRSIVDLCSSCALFVRRQTNQGHLKEVWCCVPAPFDDHIAAVKLLVAPVKDPGIEKGSEAPDNIL